MAGGDGFLARKSPASFDSASRERALTQDSAAPATRGDERYNGAGSSGEPWSTRLSRDDAIPVCSVRQGDFCKKLNTPTGRKNALYMPVPISHNSICFTAFPPQ